jgi:hypothetical protein
MYFQAEGRSPRRNEGNVTDEELTHLEKLLTVATPGPWVVHRVDGAEYITHEIHQSEEPHTIVATTDEWHHNEPDRARAQVDADLIVALRIAAPDIFAELRRSRALRAAALAVDAATEATAQIWELHHRGRPLDEAAYKASFETLDAANSAFAVLLAAERAR